MALDIDRVVEVLESTLPQQMQMKLIAPKVVLKRYAEEIISRYDGDAFLYGPDEVRDRLLRAVRYVKLKIVSNGIYYHNFLDDDTCDYQYLAQAITDGLVNAFPDHFRIVSL